MRWVILVVGVSSKIFRSTEPDDDLIRNSLCLYGSDALPLPSDVSYTFCISPETYRSAAELAGSSGVDVVSYIEKCLSIYLRYTATR